MAAGFFVSLPPARLEPRHLPRQREAWSLAPLVRGASRVKRGLRGSFSCVSDRCGTSQTAKLKGEHIKQIGREDGEHQQKDAPHGKPRVERATYLLLRFMRRKQTVESDYPTTAYAVPSPDKGRLRFGVLFLAPLVRGATR